MKISPIQLFTFRCYPNRPRRTIRYVDVIIVAENKDEAHRVFLEESHSFFDDEDLIIEVIKGPVGYKQDG